MEFKGTKGEWIINRNNVPDLPEVEFEIEGDNMQVALSFDYNDAKLIAAAPELLKELKESNTDLIIIHGHILSELKNGNTQWEGVDEIIYQRIEENKKIINKAL